MAADAKWAPFGERLRRLRVAAGLSQEALAERAGLSAQAIGALETGKRRRPYPQTVAALAEALELSGQERAALANARVSAVFETLAPQPALPHRLTRLVGREADVRGIVERLRAGEDRLLTLTGPGGVGKTSLALAVAAAASDAFGGDVAFIPLASITDAGLISAEVASVLELSTAGQQTPDEVVRTSLRTRSALLVLDNLEHLPAAALWVADLLAACPNVTVLATSRSPLRLKVERELPVPPLALPESDAGSVPTAIEEAPAVRLFIERAATPAFALTPANAAAVAAICRRVDGLPLAIELAAARVKVLSPPELLARLDRMLPMLTGGAQDQATRLQSMGAAIAWSYDLLDPNEQAIFRRLAVFAGGFTLEAAEWVAGETLRLMEPAPDQRPIRRSPTAVLDLVASLVDKSLVQRLDTDGSESRFGMLTPIQAFGLEHLEAAGEVDVARRAHASYYLELAEQAWPAFRHRTGQELWLERLEAERGNLRSALVWLDEAGNSAALLRLTGALSWFWYIRGPLGEGRSWLERAIATQDPDVPGAWRARVVVGAGLIAHFQGDDEQAQSWLEASLTISSQPDDPWLQAFSLLLLGMVAEDQAAYDHAESRFRDALARFQAEGDPSNAALTLTHLGVVAWGQDDIQRAREMFEEARSIQRVTNDEWGLSISLGYLGLLSTACGEYANAATFHRESLQLRWDSAVWEDVAASLADLATLAAAVERSEQAARLFGAAAAVREETGRLLIPLYPERVVFEQAEDRAKTALGPDAYAAAETAGRALTRERSIAEALNLADEVAGETLGAHGPQNPNARK